jgi:hypothetical protein
MTPMTRVEKIEKAIAALPKDEFATIREWILNLDWEQWDREIEYDAKAGELDFLGKEAAET